MRIFFLEGSWEEMGRKWAEGLKREALESVRYFMNSASRSVAHTTADSSIKRLAAELLTRALLKYKARKIHPHDRAFLSAMAGALGVSESGLLETFCAPDVLNYLLSLVDHLSNRALPPVIMGCSSAVVLKGGQQASSYHARNLDYVGGRYWERGHCILVMRPRKGLASVSVTSEGMYCPGVTTVNEAGLSMSLHLNFTSDRSLRGVPITTVVSLVASRAKTPSEAVDILRREKPMSGWCLVLSNGTEAVAVELSAGSMGIVHPEGGILCYTNMYISPNMADTEYVPSYIWAENNNARYRRMKGLLLEGYGSLDAEALAGIMSDTFDITHNRETALGHTISNAANISCAIISTTEDALWASDSPVPASRGRFPGFRLSGLLEGKKESIGEIKGKRLPRVKEEAFRWFVEACFVWEESMQVKETLERVNQAVALDPEPLYLLVKGWLEAKLGRLEEANACFSEVLRDPGLPKSRRAQALLWKARMCDLTEKRAEAKELYRDVLRLGAPLDLQNLAVSGLKRPYSKKRLKGLEILPFIADFVDL